MRSNNADVQRRSQICHIRWLEAAIGAQPVEGLSCRAFFFLE
jgi:hypothetical protein